MRSSSPICFHSSVGVAHRVVLELAHHRQGAVGGAHLAHGLAQHVLLRSEFEVQHVPAPLRASSGLRRRRHGLSASSTGSATACRARALHVSVDRQGDVEADPAAPGVVDADLRHHAVEHHGVAGEHRVAHAEGDPAQPPVGAGPVGDVALEPRRLVGGVEEDVAGPVALHGEVLVVVHGPPVARGQRAEHDRGGAHVVGQRGQEVTLGHVAEHAGPVPARSRRCAVGPAPVAEPGVALDPDECRRAGWCTRRR